MPDLSARQSDVNGYIEIDGNPISKVGVFPYLGREIGAPDPSKVYYVYRPEEELASEATIESFKLMPLVDEHAMLGSEDDGFTPAEQKGVQGVIGESVYYEAPYLKAKLKIFSESAKRMVATGEKVELSPGYRCRYEFTEGEFNGQKYDAIQRSLIGNHLALVTEGRTGPDVAVLDHAGVLCALDSNSLKEAVMADENKQDVEVKDDLDQLKKAVAALSDEDRAELLKAFASDEEVTEETTVETDDVVEGVVVEESNAEVVEAAESAIEAATEAVEAVSEAAEEVKEAAEELKTATDSASALKKLADAQKKLAKAKGAPVNVVAMDAAPVVAMDEKAIVAMIADRDSLARKVSGFVGSFDHSAMTASQVAEYAVSKLGIQSPKGSERIALDGWLHGRTPDHKQPTFAADGGMKKLNLAEKRSKQ